MEELKPCPFCGSSDARYEHHGYGGTVTCDDCLGSAPNGEVWNARVPERESNIQAADLMNLAIETYEDAESSYQGLNNPHQRHKTAMKAVLDAIVDYFRRESIGLSDEDYENAISIMASEIGKAGLDQPYEDNTHEAKMAFDALLERFEIRRRR